MIPCARGERKKPGGGGVLAATNKWKRSAKKQCIQDKDTCIYIIHIYIYIKERKRERERGKKGRETRDRWKRL
jgi:hypothetical protein